MVRPSMIRQGSIEELASAHNFDRFTTSVPSQTRSSKV